MADRVYSLRQTLEAGEDISTLNLWFVGFAEELYTRLPFTPPKQRQHIAAEARAMVDDLAEYGEKSRFLPVWEDGSRGIKNGGTFMDYIRQELWRAEIYEDPELAERLKEALPDDIRAKFEYEADAWRRSHPIEIKVPDVWWHCNNCGATFDEGEAEAVVITDRESDHPGHSSLDYHIEYCFDCIRMVAEVIGQTAGN